MTDKKKRNQRILDAKRTIMQSHEQICITCGTTENLTPSHLLKIRSRNNDPGDPKYIVIQCLRCHIEYEKLNPESRYVYWRLKGREDICESMKKIMFVRGNYENVLDEKNT